MKLEKITKLSWICDLHRLAQSSATSEDSARIYRKMLVHIVDGFGAKSGCLALYTDSGIDLTVVAGIDMPGDLAGKPANRWNNALGSVVQSNTPMLLNDMSGDEGPADQEVTETVHSAACWPLGVEGKAIGAVCVSRASGMPGFGSGDLEQGTLVLNLASLVLSNIQLQISQQRRIEQLREAKHRLEDAQSQLVQAEKMSSIGQMAAGVAHEINNPIGFVSSNLGSLENYLAGVFHLLEAYEKAEAAFGQNAEDPVMARLAALKRDIDLEFLKQDVPQLMRESREGVNRVKTIVQNLKNFSRIDSSDEWQSADLHEGLQSTISIVWNQLKYKAEISREYHEIPRIECLPSQLNQVFLNMLVNAGHAIGERGLITIRTWMEREEVFVSFSDTGCGITPENLQRIFDPFFTTKKVGEGTGLGLSISYGIVQKHHGGITVDSQIGRGTTFTIRLPVKQDVSHTGLDDGAHGKRAAEKEHIHD